MENPSWARHLPYWLAILLLGILTIRQHYRTTPVEITRYVSAVLLKNQLLADQVEERNRDKAARSVMSYNLPSNIFFYARLLGSEQGFQTLSTELQAGRLQAEQGQLPDTAVLKTALMAYRDSLLAYSDQHPGSDTVMYYLRPRLNLLVQHCAAPFSHTTGREAALLLQTIQTQAAWDRNKVARYCSKNLIDENKLKRLAFMPVMERKKSRVRVGERMEFEVYSKCYDLREKDIAIRVDGEWLPVEEGSAYFSRVFHRPGRKCLPVVLRIQNPFNEGEFRELRSEFEVEVLLK